MRIVIDMSNYMDDDIDLDQSDSKSKIEMMCYLIPTNKLCVV